MKGFSSVNIRMLKVAGMESSLKVDDKFILATREVVNEVKVDSVEFIASKEIITAHSPQGCKYLIEYNLYYKTGILIYDWCNTTRSIEFKNVPNTYFKLYTNLENYYNGKDSWFYDDDTNAYILSNGFDLIYDSSKQLYAHGYCIENNVIKENTYPISRLIVENGMIYLSQHDKSYIKENMFITKDDAAAKLRTMVKINTFNDDLKKNKKPTKIGSLTIAIYDTDKIDDLKKRLETGFEEFFEK